MGAKSHLGRLAKARSMNRARKIGRTVFELATPEQQEQWKNQIIQERRDIVRVLLEVDPLLRDDLLLSGHLELKEISDHQFWGGDRNVYGDILMDLREQLRADQLDPLPEWFVLPVDRPRRTGQPALKPDQNVTTS